MPVTITEWRGDVADQAGLLDVSVTDSYRGADGQAFALPTRGDYEERLHRSGHLPTGVALAADPILAAAAQAHWHSAGPNACVFAREISADREAHGWTTVILQDIADPPDIARTIASEVSPRVQDPDLEVVSVLLPELDDEALLASVVARLGGLADWQLRIDNDERSGVVSDENSPVRLGLRVAVEFDHWSEVLGFGRFSGQANTRLAPFTEFAIRAKAPDRPRRNQRAYMADIPVDLDTTEFGEWWHQTHEERLRRLAPDQDLRGKAKVTFAVSRETWRDRR